MDSIGAMILAAGGSSRMGRAKQLLKLDGESLVHRTARTAIQAQCSPIVVVTGAQADEVTREISDLPVHVALNPDWENGMGGSIRAGLSQILALEPNVQAAVILLCDQPNLSSKILTDLFSAFSSGNKTIAACRYAATLGPPCCFAKSMFNDLLALADGEGAKKLLVRDPSRVTTIDWEGGESDLDTPQDWERFCNSNPSSRESAR
jgi:molybdenum cofactor cytidylyltransferase